MHDAASAWNAGFIRQVCNRRVLLPDKSGVPVMVSSCTRRSFTGHVHLYTPALQP
jgi:hypothetical protein